MEGIEIPRRMDVIRKHRERGGLVAAVFPIHYPRSLLRAFNILPVEVWGPPRVHASYGAAHLQSHVCSIVQNAVSFLQSSGLDLTDLLFVPHACDSLQGLGSLLLDFLSPKQPTLTLYIPRGRRASDVDFLAEEFRSIYQHLQALTGRVPLDTELAACIHSDETADGLLVKLHQQHQNLPLSDEAFYRLIRSREYLPAEEFTELAQKVVARTSLVKREGIPILLSGIVPEPMSIFEAIADLGGIIAADDLACCGRRLYHPGQSEDPYQRMAERIVYASPDPTRGSSIQERLDHLLRLAKSSEARGVIFYEVKFCEPELFDLPQLRQGLREAGLPSIAIELDLNDQLSQSILTRLAAFLEMVG